MELRGAPSCFLGRQSRCGERCEYWPFVMNTRREENEQAARADYREGLLAAA